MFVGWMVKENIQLFVFHKLYWILYYSMKGEYQWWRHSFCDSALPDAEASTAVVLKLSASWLIATLRMPLLLLSAGDYNCTQAQQVSVPDLKWGWFCLAPVKQLCNLQNHRQNRAWRLWKIKALTSHVDCLYFLVTSMKHRVNILHTFCTFTAVYS